MKESMKRLDELEAKLRDEARHWAPSPDPEAALAAEFTRRKHVPIRRIIESVAGLALAASLLITFWPKPAPQRPAALPAAAVVRAAVGHVESTAPAAPAAPAAVVEPAVMRPVAKPRAAITRAAYDTSPDAEFVRIPYTAPLESWERAEIVRTELSVAALVAAGIRVPVADTSARALVDLLVGQDGIARAVRIVAILNRESD
jgi:hypothetical protein